MSPFLTLLLLHRPIDGEDAVRSARAFLARMYVRNPGDLSLLSEQRASDWQMRGAKVWSIGFGRSGDDKGDYYVSVDERGDVFRAGRMAPSWPTDTAKNAEAMKRAQKRLMDRVPHALPVRSHRPPESFYADGGFDVLAHGLPFFNENPAYRYTVMSDARGAFALFNCAPEPPPVVSPRPKVSQKAALPRLVAMWGKTPHTGPFPQHVRAELGYYLVKGEKVARLVWRGWVYQDRNPLFDGASPLKGFLDANTGDLVRENPGQ